METFYMVRTVIIGLVVGSLIRYILPGRDTTGIFAYLLLGVGGAFLGGFAGRFVGISNEAEIGGVIMNVVGAIMLPAILKQMEGNPK